MTNETEASPPAPDTSPDTHSPDTRRDELRAKIEASERRIAERTFADQAKEATEAATQYVRENPLKVIGGAIVVGLLIGLATRPGRAAARSVAASAGDAVSRTAKGTAQAARNVSGASVSRFGALVADGLIAYGMKLVDEALDASRAGQDALEDMGDSATAKARELRREAGYIAGTAVDKGRTAAQRTRRRASRAVRDLKDRVQG